MKGHKEPLRQLGQRKMNPVVKIVEEKTQGMVRLVGTLDLETFLVGYLLKAEV